MFRKVSCTPLLIISLCRKSSVLMPSGSSSSKILANVTNWQISYVTEMSKSSGSDLMSCSVATQLSSKDSSFRWLKKLNFLEISSYACRRLSSGAMNWSITSRKLSFRRAEFYFFGMTIIQWITTYTAVDSTGSSSAHNSLLHQTAPCLDFRKYQSGRASIKHSF